MTLRGVALRLQGPLQAWDGPSVGDNRGTLPFPTRSGVLGLVAACLGIGRFEMDRLLKLATGTRVHVRVDSPGTPLVDDQTIQDHPEASSTRKTIQSKRTYLCDASFAVVVVPGAGPSVEEIAFAVKNPVFSPFLGRRTCVPSAPLLLADLVSADDPLGLFDSLPRGPQELIARLQVLRMLSDSFDFYLDADDHPQRLRRLPVRDNLTGPLVRQFRERTVVHLRTAAPPTARGGSIDPWMINQLF